jgi:prepilin-type N-terminal cleavage/methylation domain-containing protein
MPVVERNNLQNRSQSGMTLVEIMVTVALLSIVGTAVFQFISSTMDQAKAVSREEELEGVRQMIRLTRNCPATMQALPAACTGSLITPTPMRVINASGADIIGSGNTTTRFGNFKLRAFCDVTPGTIRIEVSDINKDNWEVLFKNTPFSCWL